MGVITMQQVTTVLYIGKVGWLTGYLSAYHPYPPFLETGNSSTTTHRDFELNLKYVGEAQFIEDRLLSLIYLGIVIV